MIAQETGKPFCTNLLITGTIAHSHTGKIAPKSPEIITLVIIDEKKYLKSSVPFSSRPFSADQL
mgnify:CR=1 FL=1